jgi:hypothetical protein
MKRITRRKKRIRRIPYRYLTGIIVDVYVKLPKNVSTFLFLESRILGWATVVAVAPIGKSPIR